MKKLILICFLFACAGAAEDRPDPVPDVACHPLDGDFDIICTDPVAQGLFSSATCYTEEELEQTLIGRQEALSSGICEPKQLVVFSEPRVLQPEIIN